MAHSTIWQIQKPHTEVERNVLFQHCGRKCFLLPPEFGHHARYPICTKTCHISKEGLKAAKRRARLVLARLSKSKRKQKAKDRSQHLKVIARVNRIKHMNHLDHRDM